MQSVPLREPSKFCLTGEPLSPLKMQFPHQVTLEGMGGPCEREIWSGVVVAGDLVDIVGMGWQQRTREEQHVFCVFCCVFPSLLGCPPGTAGQGAT